MSVDVSGSCLQRRKQMLFTIPPIRLEKVSPYDTYTKAQLDMRRKAEILQYKGNTQASKGNNLTKKQRMAQILSGKYQNSNYPGKIVQKVTAVHNEIFDISENAYSFETITSNVDTTCNNEIIYTPTSSSDVPGPSMLLYNDETIPLYNYKKNVEALAIVNDDDNDEWRYNITENTFVLHNNSGEILSLGIQYGIQNSQNTYSFQIPYGIFVRGFSTGAINTTYDLSLNLSTTSPFNISVLYNGGTVIDPNTSATLVPSVSYTDSSFNVQLLDTSFNEANVAFQAVVHGGTIQVSNINLFTERGFVYDVFGLPKISLDTPFGYSDDFTNVEYGVVFNLSSNNLLVETNCSVYNQEDVSYNSFSLNGSYLS